MAPHRYVHIRYQGNLYQKNDRNAIFEFLVHRLMAPNSHGDPCSDASTEDSQHQKCGFRNALHRFLGLVFVNAVYDERDCIDGKKIVGEATMQSVHYSIQKTL